MDLDPGSHRTAIIVSGMHRSGTSAITRVVSLLGAGVPGRMIEVERRGERCSWEQPAVVEMNERVLERFGSWWAGWESIDRQELLSMNRVVERTRRLVRGEFGDADSIIVKDPRIARLLPLWTHALEMEGFRCVHVIALRQPAAVADAVARQDQLSPKATALAWLAHSLDAEFHTRAQPRVVVSVENLLRDWRSEADRVGRALDVEWPQSPHDFAGAISEVIEPGLVPERSAPTPKGPVTALMPVYDVLKRWSEDNGRPGDGTVLDCWRVLLEPIRSPRSGTARISIERREVIADLEVRERPVGPFGDANVWDPIARHGYNLEADAAWAWLRREREHDRAMRPSGEHPAGAFSRGGRALPGLLLGATRRLGRQRRLPAARR